MRSASPLRSCRPDFAALGDGHRPGARRGGLLHVDVMDGHFVPNLTIGPPVVAAIRRHTDLYLDCHLMMTNPGDYLEAFAAGRRQPLQRARGDRRHRRAHRPRCGTSAWTSAWPSTPRPRSRPCEPWLDQIDLLLVMSVHPGFGGQHFMAEAVPKVARGRRASPAATARRCSIEVDGGHRPHDTSSRWPRAGADIFVAGSAIFGQTTRPAASPTPSGRGGHRSGGGRRPGTCARPRSSRVRRGDGRDPGGPFRRGPGRGPQSGRLRGGRAVASSPTGWPRSPASWPG